MVLKARKRTNQKEKQGWHPGDAETFDYEVASFGDRRECYHIGGGINLDKLSRKLRFSECINCEDCRENVEDRRAIKGKAKQGKKVGIYLKSDSKGTWICLECGHFSCGGVKLPKTDNHAIRHAKQSGHHLVVNSENHPLLWCFLSDKLIADENSEGIHEFVKLVLAARDKKFDSEDDWFGSSSSVIAVPGKSDYSISVSDAFKKGGYLVKGLDNLGNTCFFNSIMQNLLAINTLRDFFSNKSDEFIGPISDSLRKLFMDTSVEAGFEGVINPKSLLESVRKMFPQFEGYKQHDSHELLKFLLEGLSEELSERNHINSDSMFVDTVFGGQVSNVLTCLECGHFSATHEPFLDFSLPVPHKKPRPKKLAQANKPWVPPFKRPEGTLPKISRHVPSIPVESLSEVQPTERGVLFPPWKLPISYPLDVDAMAFNMGNKPMFPSNRIQRTCPQMSRDVHLLVKSGEVESIVHPAENLVLPPWNLPLSDPLDLDAMAFDMGITPQDLSAINNPKNQESVENIELQPTLSGSFNSPTPVSNDIDISMENNETSLNQDVLQNDAPLSINLDSSARRDSGNAALENSSDNVKKELNSIEKDILEKQSEDKKEISDFENDQNAISQFHGKLSAERSLTMEHPLRVQDFEVLSLPYKDVPCRSDAFSSAIGSEHDSSFDRIDDFFNEHKYGYSSGSDLNEIDDTNGPLSVESCFSLYMKKELLSKDEHGWECDLFNEHKYGYSSGSDPYEIDYTDGRLSVESLFSLYMKKELLSKDEHGWECDNCSKILCENFISSEKNLLKHVSEVLPNGFGIVEENRVDETEMNVLTCQFETKEHKMINACHDRSESGVSEEKVNSENLKAKRDATKSMLINKAPSILTIHLKRFSQDFLGGVHKLNGRVNFEETIDLKPYMDPSCIGEESQMYRLLGVVEHEGTMRWGHYVAYVRGTKSNGLSAWYYASDADVREVSLEDVLRREAYILFYERK